MQGTFLLNIVVRQCSTIFELLSGKDQSLLIRRDAFLVLDLSLHIIDGVRWLHFKSDGFSSQSFHEYLHVFEFYLISL